MKQTEKAPSEVELAGNVARFVQIREVYLSGIQASLLVPRETYLAAGSWHLQHWISAEHGFEESSRLITVTLRLRAVVTGSKEGEEGPGQEFFTIECVFVLVYSFNVKGGPPPEERDQLFSAFAKINGTYNAWPYFRETVQSIVGRMGLPPVVVPVYRVP